MKNFLKAFGLILLLVLFVACKDEEPAPKDYTVTIPTSEHGTVTSDKSVVKEGESVTFTVTANDNYVVSSFKVNNTAKEIVDGQVQVTNVTANLSVEVVFVGIEVKVNFSETSISSVNVRYDGTYGQLPTPTPEAGYDFAGWYTEANGQGSLITGDVVVSRTSEHTLYAYFTPKSYTVTFNPSGGSVETASISLTIGAQYGTLPVATKDGYLFLHWEDENNDVVTSTTVYNFSKNTTLTAKYAQASVSGTVDELIRMPNATKPSGTISVSLTDGTNDVTNSFTYSLQSSNTGLVVIDGMNFSLADGAEGQATISVYAGTNLIKQFTVKAMDYHGLGYQAVSVPDDFFLMGFSENNKFVLVNDIDLKGAGLWTSLDWQPLIQTLAADGVIDGAGHIVSNALLLDGWNNGWIKVLEGTLRNIAFIGFKSGQPSPFEAALIGRLAVGGLIENVFLQIEVQKDGGPASEHKAAGMLVGTLDGGTIRDTIVDVSLKEGLTSVSNVAALVANAGRWGTENDGIFNSYAIVNNTHIPAYAIEAAEGVFAYNLKSGGVFETVYEFINSVNPDNFDSKFWSITSEGVKFGGTLLIECEPELEIKVEDTLTLDLIEGPVYFDVGVYSYGSLVDAYTISYSSDNTDVLTVSEDGIFTPLMVGTARITITVEGLVAYCDVTVIDSANIYISNADEFRQLIKAKPDGSFILTADIDIAGGWLGEAGGPLVETFSGTLDGNGHKIYNGWLPGGWNKGLFVYNTGTIKNVAFMTIYGTATVADTGLIAFNKGTIENVYLDFVVFGSIDYTGTGGTLVGGDDGGHISNCIINVRLADGETLPGFYGSIVGRIYSWATKIENCFSIVNGLAINDIAFAEAAPDIIAYNKLFNTKQYADYETLFGEADLSSFGDLWEFTATGIKYNSAVVLGE